MIVHTQRAHREQSWFCEAAVAELPDGRLDLPAAAFWIGGEAFPLPSYQPQVGTAPFTLWIEPVAGSVDYFLDTTGVATPVAFPRRGCFKLAWRTETNGEIHVLRHVD